MRIIKFCFLTLLSLVLFGCEKESAPNPIKCELSYNFSSTSFEVGDHIIIKDFNIKPISPANGIDIKKIEFFLGNKLINSCPKPPYELDYEIPNILEGKYLLQIDIHLEANGYDDTIVWIKHNIEINKSQNQD